MDPEARLQESQDRIPYESPAIIYEGEITTRAGSPPGPGFEDPGVDPADLFGNSG